MKYWVNSSDEDYDAMQVMYKNKKNTWTLFLGYLVIEKLLKGLYAKKNEENPYTIKSHNLFFDLLFRIWSPIFHRIHSRYIFP